MCMSHADCHIDLNERCVHVAFLPYMVCGCGQSFVRNTSNNVCELKRGIRLVFRFNSLPFAPEYYRTNTPGFIRMKELIETTLFIVINASTQLSQCVKDTRVISFRRPHDDPTDSSLEAETLMFITNSLYQSIKSREKSLALVFVKELAVSIHAINASRYDTSPEFDAIITEIEADINSCAMSDLNYCSTDASCMFFERENRFSCMCRDRFTDTSPHPRYQGEICSLECPEDYCSNDGHCHVDKLTASLYCTCNHWNVGARCQYSGIVVFSILGIVVILLLFVVGCTASVFCGGSRSSSPVGSSELSQRSLLQPKPSLLSSSCEDHSVRPFRITIDNMNYGDGVGGGAPIIQFSPGTLVQQASRRESTDYGHHNPPSTVSHGYGTCPSTLSPHHLMSYHPTPIPSPSISTAVQTEPSEQMIGLSPASFEVSLDKPSRGLKVPSGSDRIYSEAIPTPAKRAEKGGIDKSDEGKGTSSWC